MKLLIIGDSHGNIANIKHVMGFAKKINASAVIHTGDWYNFDSIKIVTDCGIPLYSCLGNADIDPRFDFKEFVELEIDNIKIGLVHNIKKVKTDKDKFDVIFCGHNHQQRQIGNMINPGALENGINFAIFDTKTKMVEFINI
ncbi:MAG: metallophosphoesterase family protein [bacterium]|nr:MAG: metallophosphoesterase family protein [bacterium]